MLGNVLAQHLHGLDVFAHGYEKLCLLPNIEQRFWIDDVVQWLFLLHISEPTRPLYISYAGFCLKKKKIPYNNKHLR